MTELRTTRDSGPSIAQAAGELAAAGAAPPSPIDRAAALAGRLTWFVYFRWVLAAAVVFLWSLLSLGKTRSLGPWPGTWLIAVAMAFLNGVLIFSLRRCRNLPAPLAEKYLLGMTNVVIAADLVLWAGLLHFTGGAMNPLAAGMVFELAVATSLLPAAQAFTQAAVGATAFAVVAALELRSDMAGAWHFVTPIAFPLALFGNKWKDTILPVGAACGFVAAVMFGTVYFVHAILVRTRRIHEKLQAAHAQLAALDLCKSRFLRVSSHQLRGPLAAIHSMLSAIQEAGGFNPKQFDLIRRIRARTEDAMAQVEEMMVLSTIRERGVETAQRQAVDARAAIIAAAAAFAEQARQKNVALEVSAGEEAMCVLAWSDALETILEHLLDNALRYTPAGGRVTLRGSRKDQRVEIAVADTGIGIPAEQQEQVFREFFRGTNARQVVGGTGLGLAIVKATVENLGGTTALTSAEGMGTTVTVSLPAA